MSSFADVLRRELASIIELSDEQARILEAHFALLERWNRKINLTAIRDREEALVRHYCESLFLAAEAGKLRLTGPSVADVGSGAGFPGFPVGVVHPSWRVTLIESHQRKAAFLREACRLTENISVQAKRLEEIGDVFQLLMARGVDWRTIIEMALTKASYLALLLGQEDSLEAARYSGVKWNPPILLPWGSRRMLLLGEVSRGT